MRADFVVDDAEARGVQASDAEALTQFLYMAPIGLIQARLDGRIEMINPLCAQLLMPLAPGSDLGNLFVALSSLAPDLQHRVQTFAAPHGMVVQGLQLPVSADGRTSSAPQVLSLSLLKLDAQRLMAVLTDVTQVVRQERALRESQVWLSTLAGAAADYSLLPLDHVGRVRSWNSSIGRLLGFDAAAIVGASAQLLQAADDPTRARLADGLADADHWGWSLAEGWRLRADGTRFRASCLITPLHAGQDTAPALRHYSLVIRDLGDFGAPGDANASAMPLHASIACDHLTGLANRRVFFDAAASAWRYRQRTLQPLSLALIDADHLQRVNTEYGRAAGDAVLRHLAAGMRATLRTTDTLARIGGEDFVVLLPGADAATALALVQRLLGHLAAQPVLFEGARIVCMASAGIASLDQNKAGDLNTLMRQAGTALRAAKAKGRNRVECAASANGDSTAALAC